MKNSFSIVLFSVVFLTPVLLFAAMSFAGQAHPLEEQGIEGVSFLDHSDKEVEVIFFGYAGCAYICPNSLIKMTKVFEDLKNEKDMDGVGLHFIDINAETQIARAEQYTGVFSEHICGHNIEVSELSRIKETFGIQVTNNNYDNSEILHTDHFFIVRNDAGSWVIDRVLSNDVSADVMKEAIRSVFEEVRHNI